MKLTNRTKHYLLRRNLALTNIAKIIEYNEEHHAGLEFEEDFKTLDETEVEDYLKWYNSTK